MLLPNLPQIHGENNGEGNVFGLLGPRVRKGWEFGLKSLKFKIVPQSRDSDGPLLSNLVMFDNNYYMKFINLYAPVIPKDRNNFFTNISQYLTL